MSQVVFWDIAKLKEHPLQSLLFGEGSEQENDALLADMRQRGQQQPLHILPDGTTICGTRRLDKAKNLGWTTIAVIVRHDLAEAGPAAIETHLINDNFVRRQLTPMEKARCVAHLVALALQNKTGEKHQREQVKQEIGDRLKLSPRSVNRYLLAMQTPRIVQDAFDRGELTLVTVCKVAMLKGHALKALTKRLATEKNVRKLVEECLATGGARNDVKAAFLRLIRTVTREAPLIRSQFEELPEKSLLKNKERIAEVRQLFHDLLAKANHVKNP